MPGSIITTPRDETYPGMGNNAYAQRKSLRDLHRLNFVQMGDLYSNELANGDKDDDKEDERETDVVDHIVDYNGQTNRGYGSEVPSAYFAKNHILPGSFITTPRDDEDYQMTNNVR